jgi:hypothetical protein
MYRRIKIWLKQKWNALCNFIYRKEYIMIVIAEPKQEGNNWVYSVKPIGRKTKVFTLVFKEKYFNKGDTIK